MNKFISAKKTKGTFSPSLPLSVYCALSSLFISFSLLDINTDTNSTCKCNLETGNIKYSCRCYYLRHQLYQGFQLELFLKLGVLVQELNKKTYFV